MRNVEKMVVLQLPEALDSKSVSPLLASLISAQGSPIEVDASHVRKVGTPGLQVLISACVTWEADGVSFRIRDPSSTFSDAAALAGGHFSSKRTSA